MHREEYEKIKDLTYLEYCDYLQDKYGKCPCDYFTEGWSKRPKVSRTSEGLFAHHKFEDHAILLGKKEIAMKHPREWQKAENIIYCDYLEHLYLHYLITKYPAEDRVDDNVGSGGYFTIYSNIFQLFMGMREPANWEVPCFEKIKDDEELFDELSTLLADPSTSYNGANDEVESKENSKNKLIFLALVLIIISIIGLFIFIL